MSAAVLMLVGGYVLLYTAWHGQSIIDLALGREGSEKIDTHKTAAPGDAPGATLDSSTPLSGFITMDGQKVISWIGPILAYGRAHGWHGKVTSGYRSPAEQKRTCAGGVQPCAEPGHSRHQGKSYPDGAVDVSEAATLDSIINSPRSPYKGKLRWAGNMGDPWHFSSPLPVSGKGY